MNWKAEFTSVKKATDLVMSDLRNLASSGDWEELMEQAKGYDQSIRKGSVIILLPASVVVWVGCGVLLRVCWWVGMCCDGAVGIGGSLFSPVTLFRVGGCCGS